MRRVATVGGGPAGLMAAERLVAVDGLETAIFDGMPTLGRKSLMAGKGGRSPMRSRWPPSSVATATAPRSSHRCSTPLARRCCATGSTGYRYLRRHLGRVLPREMMKVAPLLRAWLHRLRQAGVRMHVRHRWLGWGEDGALRFATPEGGVAWAADATVLALGGGSWPHLGSDAAWVPLLEARGVSVARLHPANCGFDVAWSEHFSSRFAGAPVKAVAASAGGGFVPGEFNITAGGIEGGLVYALSAPLRDALERNDRATLTIDLAPGRPLEKLAADLARPRGRDSLANHLRRRAGIDGVKAGLLREFGQVVEHG